MKIDVEIIDSKGFWHKKTAKSKSILLKWLKSLKEGTEIYWRSKNSVFVSQQYILQTILTIFNFHLWIYC